MAKPDKFDGLCILLGVKFFVFKMNIINLCLSRSQKIKIKSFEEVYPWQQTADFYRAVSCKEDKNGISSITKNKIKECVKRVGNKNGECLHMLRHQIKAFELNEKRGAHVNKQLHNFLVEIKNKIESNRLRG